MRRVTLQEKFVRERLSFCEKVYQELKDEFLNHRRFASVSDVIESEKKRNNVLKKYKLDNNIDAIEYMVQLDSAIAYFRNKIYFDFGGSQS